MAPRILFALLALPAALAARRSQSQAAVTPIQKVLQLMEEVKAKGTAEKHEEEKEFAEFHEWCDNVRRTKTKSIAEAKEQIIQLEADIEKAEADAETLASEIADLEAAIAKATDEAKSATAVRKEENKDFLDEKADLSESIDACQRALAALKAREADVPQASLMQLQGKSIVPTEAKSMINAFLAMHNNQEPGVPEANSYEFQSGGVVGMLEKLEIKFKDQLLALEKEEMNLKSNYDILMQRLTDNIKNDKKLVGEKTETKAQRLEDAAAAKGDLKSTQTTLAEDEKTLSDTLAQCHAQAEEFEKNQVTRAEEVRAIEKAMAILSGDKVQGNAETYLPSFYQTAATVGRVMAQLQGSRPARQQLVEMLQAQAAKLNSRVLAVAASRAAADPFGKVKKMIQDLIWKLQEEANAEADAHAYCQTELAKNKKTREYKTAEVEELTATHEQLTAESATLAQEIAQLTDAIAEIKAQQADSTKIRNEEKATNTKTVADAKEAQQAVAKATQVLRDFYGKASESAFVQNVQGGAEASRSLRSEMSDARRAPYQGQQDSSTGIFGMLEVVLSDFVRLETETQQAEEAAASAYEKFMNEAEETVAVKTTEVEHKTGKKSLTDEKARSTKKDLELTHEELSKAMDVYDTLKAQCVDAGMSYEERVAAREQEIQSLKEALEILDQGDLSF